MKLMVAMQPIFYSKKSKAYQWLLPLIRNKTCSALKRTPFSSSLSSNLQLNHMDAFKAANSARTPLRHFGWDDKLQ